MKGIVSFHPIDPRFFEGVVAPLVAGSKVDLDRHLEAAVRLNPDFAPAYRDLGTALMKAGREDDARRAFRAAESLESPAAP